MSENERVNDEPVLYYNNETESLLDGMSDRIDRTMEDIAEMADEIEELSSEIKSVLEELRMVQGRTGPQCGDRLEPLVDQLEGVSRELENAVWTMDCVKEGLPEDIDVAEILQQPVDCTD